MDDVFTCALLHRISHTGYFVNNRHLFDINRHYLAHFSGGWMSKSMALSPGSEGLRAASYHGGMASEHP